MRERLFEPLQPEEQIPALVGGLPAAGIELERMLKAEDGLGRAVEIDQNIAEIDPQFGVIRLELHRLVEGFQRLFVPPLPLQCAAEARQIDRLGS